MCCVCSVWHGSVLCCATCTADTRHSCPPDSTLRCAAISPLAHLCACALSCVSSVEARRRARRVSKSLYKAPEQLQAQVCKLNLAGVSIQRTHAMS